MPRELVLALATLLALSACEPAPRAADAPLAGARIGGEFVLTSEDGKQARWSDFGGKYRTIYFGYTFCPDICPTDVQRAMAGLRQFEKSHPARGAKVQPLFVSVDPERDTPAVLREFTDAFHPRLVGLTGDEAYLHKVAEDFAVTFSRGEEQPGGGYLVNHMGITYLFDPDGKPLATLPTDQGPAAVAAELEKWVH